MVAASNKLIFAIIVIVTSTTSYAGGNLNNISEASLQISLQNYETAKNRLEHAIERCEKKRKTISKSLISPLSLELDQIKVALFVLNSRAENFCEEGARETFFVAASIHREVSRHYGVSAGDALDYTEDLMFDRHWRKFEIEAEYLLIDEGKRKTLESIEELKVPFLVLETLELIESEK